MHRAAYAVAACQLQLILRWPVCGNENGAPTFNSFPFPVGVIVNLGGRGQCRHSAGGGCFLPPGRRIPGLGGCCHSTGKPRACSAHGVLAKAAPVTWGLLQHSLAAVPRSPSTQLLQCRWLLQGLTRVGYSGQQHPVASSCSQKPLKQFYSRVHPAPLCTQLCPGIQRVTFSQVPPVWHPSDFPATP